MFIDYFFIWDTFPLIKLFLIEKLILPGDGEGMELADVLMDHRDTVHLGFAFITSSWQMLLLSGNYEWKQQIMIVCVSPTEISRLQITLQSSQTSWNTVYVDHFFEITSFIRPTAVSCYLLYSKYILLFGWTMWN